MNSQSKVDFPMIKNNDFLISLFIIYYIYCILYISKQSEIGDRLAGRDFQYLRRLLLTCEYWVSYFGEGPRESKRAVGWDEIYKDIWILLPVSISLTCDIHFKPRLLKCSIFMFTNPSEMTFKTWYYFISEESEKHFSISNSFWLELWREQSCRAESSAEFALSLWKYLRIYWEIKSCQGPNKEDQFLPVLHFCYSWSLTFKCTRPT